MKKTNKGFSMVELIIVIAIMAILAGALAPALIKYINKSRISTDIQTANSIATAIQSALANEKAYDGAAKIFGNEGADKTIKELYGATGGNGEEEFAAQIKSTLGEKVPQIKSKKCMAGTSYDSDTTTFSINVNLKANTITIKESEKSHVLYPTAAPCLTDDSVGCNPSGTTD